MKDLEKLEKKLNKEFEKALKKDNIDLASLISQQLDLIYNKQLQLKLNK